MYTSGGRVNLMRRSTVLKNKTGPIVKVRILVEQVILLDI